MNNLHAVPRLEHMGSKRTAHHDFLVDFHGNAPVFKAQFVDQSCGGQPLGNILPVAIQQNLHAIFLQTACLHSRYNLQTFLRVQDFYMLYDVVVVGGGLIGMITARTLRIAGLYVALLEKNRLGKESSWAAGGILSKLYPWQQSEAVRALIGAGQSAFPAFVAELHEETGVDPELLQSGMLVTDLEEQDTALAWARQHDTRIERVDRNILDELEPNLAKTIEAALYVPSVMQVRPRLVIEAVRNSLGLHGVQIFEGITVTGLLSRSGKVTGVETSRDNVHAGQVVVCNGAWAQQLLQTLSDSSTDIVPVRGQMLLFKTRQFLLSHILVQAEHYVIPRKDPYILCGSTLEYAGFDPGVTPDAKDSLRAQALRLCPRLSEEELVDHWAGLRPGTAREVPYICAHPEYENLYINAGHFRYGIIMSLPSAEIACDLVTGKTDASQMSAYGWQEPGAAIG